jgi:hypothetical protein
VTLPGFPIDPVATISTGSGADQVSFAPTGDIPETNVQAAIERVQANLVAPLLAGGIGVVGNADTLANIDATDIPSGAYRYTTGAAGTFPAGVLASSGGTITLWRQTANAAVMYLVGSGRNVTWTRALSGGTWGAWNLSQSGLATQAEAEAGTENTKAMTALRVEQHMIANAVGWNQSWGDYTGSRSVGVAYQNTTSRPIMVSIQSSGSVNGSIEASSDGSTWPQIFFVSGDRGVQRGAQFIVPVGHFYRITGVAGITRWAELR